MKRWLAICLALAGPIYAQDGSVRPVTRELPYDVRPLARPAPQQILATDARTRAWARAEIGFYARPADDFSLPVPLTSDLRPTLRPYERPDLAYGVQTRPIYRAEIGLFAFSPNAIATSLQPIVRPRAIETAATERRLARLRGQVCGDPAIQGEAIGRVAGRGACGIEQAVRVRSVAGITLQPRATIDCRTASALKKWIQTGVKPAVGNEGGGVASLRVVSHYSCRNRNNAASGRLSEHAFGRAIDIAGIGLRSGREITLLTDWNTARDGARLRQMWRAACGPFGTVLGPESNRFHRDHFHFDTARYRSGSYCR